MWRSTVAFRNPAKLTQCSRGLEGSLRSTSQLSKDWSHRLHTSASLNKAPLRDNVFYSPYPDITVPKDDVTLTSFLFDKMLEGNPHQTAIMDGITGESVTYAGLHENAMRFASGLRRHGLPQGGVVLLYMANCVEYATAFLGILAAGGVVSTANTLYTARELERQLENSGAVMLVTSSSLIEPAREAARGRGLSEVIVTGVRSEEVSEGVRLVPFDSLTTDSGSALPSMKVNNRTTVAVLPYSSGTTGPPKGVQNSHLNLIVNLLQISANSDVICMSRRENESILALMPFYHIYGMVVLLLNGLLQCTKLISVPKFEPESFLSTVEKHRISQLFIAPPLAVFLCKHPSVANYDLSSVYNIACAAAPLGANVAKGVVDRMPGAKIMQGFGLTELSPVSHWSPFSAPRDGAVGLPLPSTEVAIFSEGKKVGPHTSGEICIRGPQVMLGYLNRPDATAEMIDADGWLHTGDIGHCDEDGFLFVTDRLKELIKRKGFQVAPAELERELLMHPDVMDAAVVGLKDEREGELPAAFVVERPGSNLTADSVKNFMSDRVAKYKQLDGGVKFVDSIPKTPSGKILRRQLRETL